MLSENTTKTLLILLAALLALSLLVNVWLIFQLSATSRNLNSQQTDEEVLAFTKMFVEDVLMATKEIDFDTRLSLETSVRGLDDKQIFDQWQRFTRTQTKEDSSNEAKILLDLLVKKIRH